MKTKSDRFQNLDLLRIVSCLMVILLHIGAVYQTDGSIFYQKTGTFIAMITRTAVPCFVMITGAFLLNDERNREYGYILHKTIVNIIIPTLFYTVFFVITGCITFYMGITENDYITIIKLTFQGYPYPHMWYMYMITGLYLSIPLIWTLKDQISRNPHIHLFAVLFSLLFGSVIQANSTLFWPIKFLPYIGYVLFADYIFQKMKNNQFHIPHFLCGGGGW